MQRTMSNDLHHNHLTAFNSHQDLTADNFELFSGYNPSFKDTVTPTVKYGLMWCFSANIILGLHKSLKGAWKEWYSRTFWRTHSISSARPETRSWKKISVLIKRRLQIYSQNRLIFWLECYWIFMKDIETALPLLERALYPWAWRNETAML